MSSKFDMNWDDIRQTDAYKKEWKEFEDVDDSDGWEGFTDDTEGWNRFWKKIDRERADEQMKEMHNMENKETSKIQAVTEAFSLADAVYKYYDGEKHKDDCLYAALNLIEHNDIERFTDELFN